MFNQILNYSFICFLPYSLNILYTNPVYTVHLSHEYIHAHKMGSEKKEQRLKKCQQSSYQKVQINILYDQLNSERATGSDPSLAVCRIY